MKRPFGKHGPGNIFEREGIFDWDYKVGAFRTGRERDQEPRVVPRKCCGVPLPTEDDQPTLGPFGSTFVGHPYPIPNQLNFSRTTHERKPTGDTWSLLSGFCPRVGMMQIAFGASLNEFESVASIVDPLGSLKAHGSHALCLLGKMMSNV